MTGPRRNSKAFVRWLKIDTPVTADGSESGVNWIRRKEQPSDRASALARTVLPVPGTSSTRMWPRQTRATSASSISWCLPKITRSTFSTTPETRAARALSTVLTYPSSLSFRALFKKYGSCLQNNAGRPQVHIRLRHPVRSGAVSLFAQGRPDHLPAERRGGHAAVRRVLDDHRHDHRRRRRRGEADEPAVRGLARAILRRAGLSGDVHPGDLGTERERARSGDRSDEHGRQGLGRVRGYHLPLWAGRDLANDVAFGVTDLGRVMRCRHHAAARDRRVDQRHLERRNEELALPVRGVGQERGPVEHPRFRQLARRRRQIELWSCADAEPLRVLRELAAADLETDLGEVDVLGEPEAVGHVEQPVGM